MESLKEILNLFYFSYQYVTIAGGIYGLIMGVNSLVREETEGTIEFLYSKPVSRSEIFFGKLGANLSLILFYLVSIFIFLTAASLMVKDEGLLVGELINKTFLLTVAIGAISLIFLFVGILLSTIMIKFSKWYINSSRFIFCHIFYSNNF